MIFSAQVFCLYVEEDFKGKTIQERREVIIAHGEEWNYLYGISEAGNVRSVFSFKAKLPEKSLKKYWFDFENKFGISVYFLPYNPRERFEGIFQIVLSKDGADDFECATRLSGYSHNGWTDSDRDLEDNRLYFPEEFYGSEVTVKIKPLEGDFPEKLQEVFFVIREPHK